MKFLLIKALAESHLYSQFVNALHGALRDIGHDAAIVVQPVGDASELTRELIAAKYDVVLSFGSVFGEAANPAGTSLFDLAGVKFLGWQVDHPIYLHHYLSRQMEQRHSVYANHNHLRFAQAVGICGRSISMLPGAEPFEGPLKDHGARDWPVFVAAAWNGVPQRPWEALEESPAKRLVVAVVERLMDDPEASLLEAFNGASAQLNLGAVLGRDKDFDAQIINLLRLPMDFIRQTDRINAVRHLVEQGFPITICGPGWRDPLGDCKNVSVLETRVDFKDMAVMYANAKVALNLNAGNGGCERALYAMMSGAAVVSEFSGLLTESFTPGQDIQLFNRARPGEIVDAVGGLLESGRGETLAHNGYARAMGCALWRHRAETLVAFLDESPSVASRS